jgi:putative membrane protein
MNGKPTSVKPRAFRLDDSRVVYTEVGEPPPPDKGRVHVEAQADRFAAPQPAEQGEAAIDEAERGGVLKRSLVSWGGVLFSALGGLVSLAVGLWLTKLLEDLFARWVALGYLGIVLAGLLLAAMLVLLGREVFGLLRQQKIARLHLRFAEARAADNGDQARRAIGELAGLYANRPQSAAARARLADYSRQIIDGRDLVDLAERELLVGLDQDVNQAIAAAAKRVSVITAISPRAILGVIFVLAAIVHLIRRIAEIYGGRPGLFGFIKLARSVATHLAITGGMAAGDSLIQQLLGHGIAARISARLGEGVLNGLLTARVGLSAMAVCRPMPFALAPQPGVKDVAPFLFASKKSEAP